MALLTWLHGSYIFRRRVERLVRWLASVIPQQSTILDIGAGDGSLDFLLQQQRPDISITSIDILLRSDTVVPVQAFDGRHIPFPDRSFDIAMFVDVLHHASDAGSLLKEAARVSGSILLKDHLNEGLFSSQTLRLMDYVGNARHGVALPYNYWTLPEWQAAFRRLNLLPLIWNKNLSLYPFPLTLWFDRSLHFIALLETGTEQ